MVLSMRIFEAAFFIDAIRDVYEARLLSSSPPPPISLILYERCVNLGIRHLLLFRPPTIISRRRTLSTATRKEPVFTVDLFKCDTFSSSNAASYISSSPPNVSYIVLTKKKTKTEYVQIKPALAIATMILKTIGKFNEGDFRANSGYLHVSIIYNASICLALWVDDLKPFRSVLLIFFFELLTHTHNRPVPKFFCVKGIFFISFWQSLLISTSLLHSSSAAKVSVGQRPPHLHRNVLFYHRPQLRL